MRIPPEFIVEEVKPGEWRICRMSDRAFCIESFPSEQSALIALHEDNFSFYEGAF